MLGQIKEYWVNYAMGVLAAIVGAISKKVWSWKREQNLLKQGLLALLHDRLYQACTFYLKRGYCSIDDRDNLEYIYRPYKAFGGNGTGEELYTRCMALPYEKGEEDDR